MIDFCKGILKNGYSPIDANKTDIVLISKSHNPTNLSNFSPISLCSVLYKLMAKVLANRLQLIIGKCIDPTQCTFIPNRLITNNVFVTYELLHGFRNRRVGKRGDMALKLDMSKTYDRVEWPFLEAMLLKLGFASTLVQLIMQCITTTSYSVVVNGHRGNSFKPSRGFRQGDSLSPFLFVICSEGLSSLMRLAVQNGVIRGSKVTTNGPCISHLLFVDDNILFGSPNASGVESLKRFLKEYEHCSGQCVNFSKCLQYFLVLIHAKLIEWR